MNHTEWEQICKTPWNIELLFMKLNKGDLEKNLISFKYNFLQNYLIEDILESKEKWENELGILIINE